MATPPRPPAQEPEATPTWDEVAQAHHLDDDRSRIHGSRADWALGPPLVGLVVAATVIAIVLVLVL
jgi:hypothetical protein